jgi:peptidyl-prolyl cis-trans isomerase A (cyclophilin A)
MTLVRRQLIAAAGAVLPAFGAEAATRAATGGDAKPRVAIQTEKGVIVIELESDRARLTSLNFLRYVDAHRYDGGTFYRAARGGGPGQGTIEAGPNPMARRFPPIPHESTAVTGLKHRTGTVSLARDAPGTGAGDFFICASPQPYLDAHPGAKGDNQGFAAFGQVVEGMSVVRTILALPTGGKAAVAAMKGQMLSPPVAIIGMKRL